MTQILARKIVNFGAGKNGTVVEKIWKAKRREDSPLFNFSMAPKYSFEVPLACSRFTKREVRGWLDCNPPYSDHEHFSAGSAVWFEDPPRDIPAIEAPRSTRDLWWQTFGSLRDNDRVDLGILEAALRSENINLDPIESKP